jgi:LysR family transcriptional regulator, benzoate and cis,cis-muconate-responsive activator of ben and cat genes
MKPFGYHPFDLRQLVSFAEIARTGSFRKAAQTLHVAQPALSRQIQKLEAALGVSLFDRGRRRLQLTVEGQELAARLPTLFSKIDHLVQSVGFANSGGAGHLRVGDTGVLTTELLAPALRKLRKNWPKVRLSFVQNTSEGFFNDLLNDIIDCAFPALEPRSIELVSHKLSTLEVGLVLPPGHRLAASNEISIGQLRDESWIFPPREANPVLYDELLSCCYRAGFSPKIIAEMTQRPRVISHVACGIGIATLVETLKHLCIGGTTYHRLIRPLPTIDCYLVYRKSDSSGLLQSFVTICREFAKELPQR